MEIGVFGPSSACSPQGFQTALGNAQSLFKTIHIPLDPSAHYASKQFLFSAASVKDRLASFKALVTNNDCSLIFAARGGYGAVDILPEIFALKDSFNLLRSGAKLYISGLSDVTLLHLALDGLSNIQLIHGPGFVDAFSEYTTNPERRASASRVIEIAEGRFRGYDNLGLSCVNKASFSGSIKGKILGGNLSVLTSLVGSKYLPSSHSRILFLEETSEKPYKVHRSLMQLKNAGLLDNLAGVLLGDFSSCQHSSNLGPSVLEVISAVFSDASYPVLQGFPAGHVALNLPLPLGVDMSIALDGIQLL